MITGEIKNKIDQIWDTFFVAGITNPITVLEQMTYIFFMKMLDDKQLQEEENARDFDGEVLNPTFPQGQLWINPDATTDEEKAGIPYESLRWHVFKNLGADNMFKVVRQHVFANYAFHYFISKNFGGFKNISYLCGQHCY